MVRAWRSSWFAIRGLANPLVYANEGIRGTLAPQVPHIQTWIPAAALVVIDSALLAAGLKWFYAKAVA